jgi:hypothetical protein
VTGDRPLERYLRLIRAEYRESPGLRLSRAQVERLWHLDRATCDAVLEALLAARFLRCTREGHYVRADRGDEVPLELTKPSNRLRPVPRAE